MINDLSDQNPCVCSCLINNKTAILAWQLELLNSFNHVQFNQLFCSALVGYEIDCSSFVQYQPKSGLFFFKSSWFG
jgi:hypothetical protein